MKTIGVYRIVAPSGSHYIGMTCDSFESRWRGHRNKLKAGTHPCSGLQAAFYKYGLDKLVFETLLEWEDTGLSQLHALVKRSEQQVWDQIRATGINLYNGRPSGTGSSFHSNETKKKMSIAAKARMEPLDEAKLAKGLATCVTTSELAEYMGMSWRRLKRRGVRHDQLKPKPITIKVSKPKNKDRNVRIRSSKLLELEENRRKRDENIAKSYSVTSLTLVELAELYGVTRQTVSAALRRQEIPARGQKRRFENKFDLAEISKRNDEGETLVSLANEIGIQPRTLSRHLKAWRKRTEGLFGSSFSSGSTPEISPR